jgi:hypothetical protein
MKKLAAFVAATALLVLGLTMVGASSSQAAGSCPVSSYVGCVTTKPTPVVPKKAPKAGKSGVKVKLGANVGAGATHPVGTVVITVKLKNKVVWKSKKLSTATSTVVSAKTPKLKKGKYTIQIVFTPKAGTAFSTSKTTQKLTVKK